MREKPIKISDSNQDITTGSRADNYWQYNPYTEYYLSLRPKLDLPKQLREGNNLEAVLKKYKIKAVGFGNWLNIEDRLNYTNAMIIAFYDLNKVLKFNYNIGIEKTLSVTFGARGGGGAMAHYEPANKIINITRYEKGDEPKMLRFLNSGGLGAFAHEYGHFLDYLAGQYFDKNNNVLALTNSRSLSRTRTGENGDLRELTDLLMEQIIWKKPNEELSQYYKRLLKSIENIDGVGDYFVRRNEIFARAFEAYVRFELKEIGIQNKFLTATKYRTDFYLSEMEIKAIVPTFRKLIAGIRQRLK